MTDELKWFTKNGDEVKGPYEAAAIRGSIAAGRLGPKTHVRREDEPAFQPIGEHPALRAPAHANPTDVAFQSGFDARAHGVPVEGSMGLGLAAGFFGGCIGWILVEALAKGAATKRGARIGFAFGLVVGVALRLAAQR